VFFFSKHATDNAPSWVQKKHYKTLFGSPTSHQFGDGFLFWQQVSVLKKRRGKTQQNVKKIQDRTHNEPFQKIF